MENNPLPKDLLLALESAEDLSILSIDSQWRAAPQETDVGNIDGFRIVHEKLLHSGRMRDNVAAAFLKAHRDFNGKTLRCFLPRHALRMSNGADTLLALLCFQCGIMRYYVNGVRQNVFYGISGSSRVFNNLAK